MIGTRRASSLLVTSTLLLVATGLSGCLHWPAQTPPPRRWVLSAGGTPSAGEAFRAVLGVGPVELPRYLDRSEIVERLGENELRANDFDLWGEPLGAGFQRVLAIEMVRRLPGLGVVGFPWKGPAAVDYRLTVVVSRFEHDVPSGDVVLEASWALSDARSHATIASAMQTLREPVAEPGFDAITKAMSRAVSALADQVADALGSHLESADEAT